MVYNVAMYTIKEKIIWTAGFMDGEGTITIKRYIRNGRVVYQPYISCVQADTNGGDQAIQFLKDTFGGSISRYQQKGQRNATSLWTVVSLNALEFAQKLLPYLTIKKERAKILVDYCKNIEKGKGGNKLSDEELKKREGYWLKMRVLNERGTLHLQRLSEVTSKDDATV